MFSKTSIPIRILACSAVWLSSPVLVGVPHAQVPHAQVPADQKDRWTLSTMAGTATLALVPEPGMPPAIMFVCGIRLVGVAQVIIANPASELGDSRFRIDLTSGSASAMASAERAAGIFNAQQSVMGEITVQQIQDLMRSSAYSLSWRVDLANSTSQPQTTAPMPHPLSRHRTEFLRFCA